ncbi:protein phosphatase 1 regulatory subunit 16A [Nilaparvata lugens]|uniref:protein phosphatase 1 regulatory subunit 16A n=1 Tax=Nilaparvata lugens TaxID=108931 RepID=UPI00193D7D4F|nr:protein phosphatase 1 regulatory subunit 16A [Nilaparvata lugens]
MEHSDLVVEMGHVEHMSTQERLHLARRRRSHQLKVWSQREKEWSRRGAGVGAAPAGGGKKKPNIRFSDNVMLLEAAARNDIAEVRKLLMRGVSPDSTNEDGLTALHQCCIDDNEDMMKLLLEFGANVNAEDSEKWTPLHAAATCGHLHLVSYLIASGANLLAVNADGNMAYDICEDEAALEHIESEMARRGVTQELIDETRAATETIMLRDLRALVACGRGGDLELGDSGGATPLHIAAANGYLRVVEFLLEEQHVATDCRDQDHWQPVHAAACWGHLEVLELLVQNGADLNAKTKHDETPADICEDPELKERILELRSEQETKRLQEAQRRRVKRTQSNNTRTQSVRRTSIRDKTLTSKKEAVEEARLRRQAQQVFGPPIDITDIGLKIADSPNNRLKERDGRGREREPVSLGSEESGELPLTRREPELPLTRREPDGKDFSIIEQEVEAKPSSSIDHLPTSTEASYTTTTEQSNGKINIHVSVTINAGTLAELKKQRAQNRGGGSLVGGGGDSQSAAHAHQSTAHAQSPSAANSDLSVVSRSPDAVATGAAASEQVAPAGGAGVKRFAGHTADNVMVGDARLCHIYHL